MRPSRVEVDLAAIAHNVRVFGDLLRPAGLIAVVKANAYGHGDVPVAESALRAGASMLAVATLEEAVRLREADIAAPVLLLSEPPVSDIDAVRKWDVTPSVYRREFIDELAASGGETLKVHLVVDTGMHRVGVSSGDALNAARQIDTAPGLELGGVWSHFAVAEVDEAFSIEQGVRLSDVVDQITESGIEPGIVHMANSAGAIHIATSPGMARIGLGMYGLHPDPDRAFVDLKPAMSVVSEVSFVQKLPAGTRPSYGRQRPLPADATVATVPIGYADGLPRLMSRDGGVLVGGVRLPFAGTITMDQVMVDCGAHDVSVGDEVVLMGSQGDCRITADDWAGLAGTISWEIVSRIGDRLPRRYLA